MSGDLAQRPPALATRRDPTTRPALRGWLLTGVAAVGFLLSALVVSAYLGAAFGVQTALLALAVALVPLGIVIPTFLWLDRFESEPTRYLLLAFLWGALVAAVVAAVFNTGAIAVLEAAADREGALADDGGAGRPVRRGGRQGCAGAARVVGPASRVRRHHRRHGLRRHLRGGLRLHREHQLPRPGLRRRRRRGAHRHLRGPLPDVTLRAPDVHGALRNRGGRRRDQPHLAAAHPRAGAGLPRSPCSATRCGTSRRSRAGAAWSWSTCSSRCRSSWPSSGSWCGRAGARAGSSASSCAPTPTPGGSRPPRSRCSRRCRSAARPGRGRGPTPAAPGWRRCAPSRTPPASSPCCAGGCTTRRPTSTRSRTSASCSRR